MKNYVMEWRPAEPIPFDGVEVVCEIRPLPRLLVMKLAGFLKQDGDVTKFIADSAELLEVADECIPEYVRNIRGFQIDGKDAQPQQLCGTLVFAELTVHIMTQLITISSLSKGDKENLKKPSTSGSSDDPKDT